MQPNGWISNVQRSSGIRSQPLEKVSRGQKVVRSEVDEQDVVAFAGTASAVCAAILRFREGLLVDKREFLFHDTQDIPALREEFPAPLLSGGQRVHPEEHCRG